MGLQGAQLKRKLTVSYDNDNGSGSTECHVSNLFGAIHDLKTPEDPELATEIARQKYNNTVFGEVARSKVFDCVTIFIVVLNAIGIGWDTDYSARFDKDDNLYKGPVYFIVMECFFCVYFSIEILIRFLAFRIKLRCLFDAWFVFDATLVAMMVIETFILPFLGSGGPLSQFSILRLLRLLRITRMAKLMRSFPQLMMIVTGIVAAMRAVVWVLVLLLIITFAWAILFTNQYHQGHYTDDEVEAFSDDDPNRIMELFGSMGKSMLSLLVMGTILDDVTLCTTRIRATGNMWMLICFIFYILLNSFMMMNMLVGILVEVVAKTAASEKEQLKESGVKESIMTIFASIDADGSGQISREEFLKMKRDKRVMQALEELNIKGREFDMYVDLLFVPDEDGQTSALTFQALLDCICQLKPEAFVSALDFATFTQSLVKCQDQLEEKLDSLEAFCDELEADPQRWSKFSAFTDGTQPFLSTQPRRRINTSMLERLKRASSADIISELTRRLGMPNLEETGVPLMMMDEELQSQLKVVDAEAYQPLGVPLFECRC